MKTLFSKPRPTNSALNLMLLTDVKWWKQMESKKKILYVGTAVTKISSGGDQVNLRNKALLMSVFKDRFEEVPLKYSGKFATAFNLFFFCLECLSVAYIVSILFTIKKKNVDCVFLSSSKYGLLSYVIRKCYPNLRIIVFFHNIECRYHQELLKSNNSLLNRIITHVVSVNERMSVNTATDCWVLNERDNSLLKLIYNKASSLILPTSFEDLYDERAKNILKPNDKFTLLFVGINFFANVDGIKWFIKNVLPAVDCRLIVVGKGMDKEKFDVSDKLEVKGYVEDLAFYYYLSDAVVLPIFSGGGMKTKTAEAMMFGCPVVGTNEAFEGYEFDFSKAGGLCNSKSEFVETLNWLNENKEERTHCSHYVRQVYLQHYALDASLVKLNQYFKQS